MREEERSRRRYNQRMPGALFDEEEEESDDELQRVMRMARHRGAQDGGAYDENMMDFTMTDDAIDFEDVKGKLSQWIARPEVERFIRKNFTKFLRQFEDENGQNVHEQRINEMC